MLDLVFRPPHSIGRRDFQEPIHDSTSPDAIRAGAWFMEKTPGTFSCLGAYDVSLDLSEFRFIVLRGCVKFLRETLRPESL